MTNNPEIADLYLLYRQCRSQQLFSLETTKGSGKSSKTVTKVTSFPTGYTHLPLSGGMMDQPHRTMQFFEVFLNAERGASSKNLS